MVGTDRMKLTRRLLVIPAVAVALLVAAIGGYGLLTFFGHKAPRRWR